MNWNSTDRDASREELIEVQDSQATIKQTQPVAFLSEVRNATASLSELHLSGYDLLIRLLRR